VQQNGEALQYASPGLKAKIVNSRPLEGLTIPSNSYEDNESKGITKPNSNPVKKVAVNSNKMNNRGRV
jgi:hypothetical protein